MKKIIFLSIIIALGTFSCSEDFITSTLYGTEDIDNYFANEDECESWNAGLYDTFAMWSGWWQQYQRLVNETATDDAWMGNLSQDNGDFYPCAFYTITPSNCSDRLYNFYYYKYQNINNANIGIENYPDVDLDDDVKEQLIGQAKFFRAFSFWELIQNFGDVVMFLEPVGTDELDVDRTDKYEVYEQIVTDLKEAAAVLPESWDSDDEGKVTSWACKALLARTYLFMASFDELDNNGANSEEYYKAAYAYADTVISQGPFSLEENFVDVWSCTNHNGVESIFEIQTSDDQSYEVGAYFPSCVNARGEIWDDDESDKAMDGWGWCVPTSNLENAFKEEGDSIRLKSTINRYGMAVYGDEEENPDYKFDRTQNKSARTWRKLYVPIEIRESLTSVSGHIPLDMILLRLGEMYLTRAEAAYKLNDESQARADINTIRNRVELDDVDASLSGNDLLYQIWKERRLELASEGMRLYDLRREKDPEQNKARISCIMGEDGTFVQYNANSDDYWENYNTAESSTKGANYTEGKHELWPIPQSEIDNSNGAISQNPGY